MLTSNDDRTAMESNVNRCAAAMESPSMPCNPIPFANALVDGCKLYGSDFVKTDKGKRILWILNAISYGQLANIDLMDEYSKLCPISG